jgi:hypothetical protein
VADARPNLTVVARGPGPTKPVPELTPKGGGLATAAFGMGYPPCIVLDRRRLCWRHARATRLGVSPEDAERQDFALDSPRGNAICRMADAAEVALRRGLPGLGKGLGGLRRAGRGRPTGRPGPPRRLCLGLRHDPGAADARSHPSRRHEQASRPTRSSPHPTTLCRYSRPKVRHRPRPPAD